ncbi:MAG: hypothetical protein ACFB03_23900 [Paracoccaceae bacterium]
MLRNRMLLADCLEIDLVESETQAQLTAWHPNDHVDQGRVSEIGAGLIARIVRQIL